MNSVDVGLMTAVADLVDTYLEYDLDVVVAVHRDILPLELPSVNIQVVVDVPSYPCNDGDGDDVEDAAGMDVHVLEVLREDLDASYVTVEAC